MLETQVIVKVHEGLHARPAAQFAKLAKQFRSTLLIGRGDAWANAKSAVKLMLLCVKQDEKIVLHAEGEDENEAVEQLTHFLTDPGVISPSEVDLNGMKGNDRRPAAQHCPPTRAHPKVEVDGTEGTVSPSTFRGIPASEGLAFGPAYAYLREELVVHRQFIEERDIHDETARFDMALVDTLTAMINPGGGGAMGNAILDAICDVASSDDYAGAIRQLIAERWSAAAATLKCGKELAFEFESLTDEYLRGRADDIRGLTREIAGALLGQKQKSLRDLDVRSIIIAEELSALDLARANLSNVLGIVCTSGSATSHVAIIARSRSIPAVLGIPASKESLRSVSRISIDGSSGDVWFDHSDEHERNMACRIDALREEQSALLQYRDLHPSTRDGRKIQIAANMGSLSELEAAQQAGAMGVGLFRTELLFMDHQRVPTEDEQYEVYATLARAFHPWPVVIRTLDVGGDKPLPGIRFPKEENPFLGWRGIRMCLDCPEVFEPQLRALLRATVHGNICIMLPMVADVDELRRTKSLVNRMAADLSNSGIPFAIPKIGIMIETPAAVLTADFLASEADFFSIGTNDLTQYIMAVDRMNPNLASLYKTEHPAVLEAVRIVCEAAKRAGINVGICGEAASRPDMIPTFVKLGVHELSMSPNSILRAKKIVMEVSSSENEEKICAP